MPLSVTDGSQLQCRCWATSVQWTSIHQPTSELARLALDTQEKAKT
jgi:hypothetical protein